jgi:hypothetical protein
MTHEPLTFMAPLDVDRMDEETQFLVALESLIAIHSPRDQNAKARVINYIHERHGNYVTVAKTDDQ